MPEQRALGRTEIDGTLATAPDSVHSVQNLRASPGTEVGDWERP